MSRQMLFISVVLALVSLSLNAADAKRRAELEEMLRVFPKSAAWEQWLQKSGELPPDFEALPSEPFLPDPLKFFPREMMERDVADSPDSTTKKIEPTRPRAETGVVESKRDWPRRREEILKAFEHLVTGTIPPPPGNTRVANRVAHTEPELTREEVLLEFGPEHKAKLHAEVITPNGNGPFPVFITQDTHRRWALIAVSRGYMACIYAGADSRDDTAEWVNVWPEHDWTKLARRAWAASRCIDYLYTRPDVDRARITLTGHSRNGKTSIIGAAFDERITAIISSSSGAGGATSFRFFSERQFGEGIEFLSRSFPDWVHPRLRFFAGREEKLPIDMHELIACIAPRPFLFSTALNDDVESVWAIEQSYYSARRTYALFGAEHAINLLYREGPHATDAHDIERYLDWLDVKFGRRQFRIGDEPMFPTYGDWLKLSREKIDVNEFRPASSETMRNTNTLKWARWALGDPPPTAISEPGSYGVKPPHVASMLGQASVPRGLGKTSINFGNYIAGEIYFPTNTDKGADKLPAAIWLHPISVSNGYVPGYRRGEPPHLALARAGFVVFAFDQIGHGARIEEVRNFYARYPHWSLLGKTIADAGAAIDALAKIPFVDAKKIWAVGFDTGGSAALHVAALDKRIAGVVAVGGFDPMRPSAANRGVALAARSQHWLPMQPRLGAFIGTEDRIPYDYRELVETISPRPVLLFAPKINEEVGAAALQKLFAPIKGVQFETLTDYRRFGPEVQATVFERMKAVSQN